jgi:hypothetical protein|tara:strand:+ start:7484 stop:7738 length:255 start_codon:yes stop_codon:yes gene_type:complete
MKTFNQFSYWLVVNAEGSYVSISYWVWGGFMVFNLFEAGIETLFWGAPFQHAWDYLFVGMFITLWLWLCLLNYEYQKARKRNEH